MAYSTDERLKSFLDTNQLTREQMCLAILALDKRFSEVRPKHPRGGPDGGRDIEAVFRGNQNAFVAVGFVNQAEDSSKKKGEAKKKFAQDLSAATNADPKPDVFIFMTNVNLTSGEKRALTRKASNAGLSYCEVFDRERLRIVLDSPDGLAARFQYLSLHLSEAEQASFFSRWGDEIQSVIASGFQDLRSTLHRVLFLQESENAIDQLVMVLHLRKSYSAEELGHFRLFCALHLREPASGVISIVFGTTDKPARMRGGNRDELTSLPTGANHGITGGQWVEKLPSDGEAVGGVEEAEDFSYQMTRSFDSIGSDAVSALVVRFSQDSFIRFGPTLTLRDLNGSMFILMANLSLGEKAERLVVWADDYELVQAAELSVDTSEFDSDIPVPFTEEELSDKWVRIRPGPWTSFSMRFSDRTPRKVRPTDRNSSHVNSEAE